MVHKNYWKLYIFQEAMLEGFKTEAANPSITPDIPCLKIQCVCMCVCVSVCACV